MKKSTRIVKIILALFLVVLMSIESFGAVVSDNDGSAFITKAEFDSLKNNFQSQIDQYNTSIDSKIDGAIASYLAGVNVAQKIEKQILFNSENSVESLVLSGDNAIKYVYGNPTVESRTEYDYVGFLDGTSTNRYKKIVRWDSLLEGEPIHKLLIKDLDKTKLIAEWDGYTMDAKEAWVGYGVTVNTGTSGIRPLYLSGNFLPNNSCWRQVSVLNQGDKFGELYQQYTNGDWISGSFFYRGKNLTFGTQLKKNAIIWQPIPYDRFNVSDGLDLGFGNMNASDEYGTSLSAGTPIKIKNFITKVKNYLYGGPCSASSDTQMIKQEDTDFTAVTNLDQSKMVSLPHVWPGDRWADSWITNWDQLYISKFGKYDDASLENGYLYLYNGFPLVPVTPGDIVEWTIKIEETGTYLMKAGTKPFNVDNTNEEPVKISIDNGNFNEIVEFTGGIDHALKLDFESINSFDSGNKTVYIKWTKKDNNGGGTLNLSGKYKKIYVTNKG